MEIVLVVILGVVQGVAEFLPISSSGHLVIAEALFGAAGRDLPQRLALNVVLHGGTLLAILAFYRRRIAALFGTERRAIGLLIVGTLPVGVIGLMLDRWNPHLLESPLLAGAMLVATGVLLLWGRRHAGGNTPYHEIRYSQAFAVGLAQSLGLLPGISRSGVTIVSGMAVGLRPDAAATFSFLLAIPAIGGACVLELIRMSQHNGPSLSGAVVLLGALTSFGVGLVSLVWLLRWIQQGWLHRFAYWCIPLGIVVIGWQLSRTTPESRPAESHQRGRPTYTATVGLGASEWHVDSHHGNVDANF